MNQMESKTYLQHNCTDLFGNRMKSKQQANQTEREKKTWNLEHFGVLYSAVPKREKVYKNKENANQFEY